MYSNGESEVILGKAIKQHNLPRDEIVVMTKVRTFCGARYASTSHKESQLCGAVSPDPTFVGFSTEGLDAQGFVNQYGLSRKVCPS